MTEQHKTKQNGYGAAKSNRMARRDVFLVVSQLRVYLSLASQNRVASTKFLFRAVKYVTRLMERSAPYRRNETVSRRYRRSSGGLEYRVG
jgi:hypothetical protein